jgi:hypothetical protein
MGLQWELAVINSGALTYILYRNKWPFKRYPDRNAKCHKGLLKKVMIREDDATSWQWKCHVSPQFLKHCKFNDASVKSWLFKSQSSNHARAPGKVIYSHPVLVPELNTAQILTENDPQREENK